MIKTEMKAKRIRQGVLKSKVWLKTASEAHLEEYEAMVRLYGTSWTAGVVCQKILEAEERRLFERRIDIAESILETLTHSD